MNPRPTTAPLPTGIVEVSRNKLILSTPPDRSPHGPIHYALAFPFQAGPRTVGLMVTRMIHENSNYGFICGADTILLDALQEPEPDRIFAATRNEIEEDNAGGPPRLFLKGTLLGGFVPLGALRDDGSPHPHAGTGFGVAQAHWFPFPDGRFSWGDPQRKDMMEVYQLAYDGERSTTRRTQVWAQNAGEPFRVADTGWAILTVEMTNAIPAGDDLLLPTMAAKVDRTAVGAGVLRWARRGGAWEPVGFEAVATAEGPMPLAPNPKERCPWMEPSLARDGDWSLLFAVRSADSFQQEGDTGQGYALRVWRSREPGVWKEVIEVPRARLNSPVTVNVAADGSAYLVSNPYDTRCIPETSATGRGRERLVLWPLNSRRDGLEPPIEVRDCLADFGEPPTPPRGSDLPEKWMADHPNGMTVRFKDGRWRHILTYRVCHSPRYASNGTTPSPHAGCYIEEVHSRGTAAPPWRFAD